MIIVKNAILFEDFKVVLEPKLHKAMPNYIREMAEYLEAQDFDTPEGAQFALRMANNDGSWQVVVEFNK